MTSRSVVDVVVTVLVSGVVTMTRSVLAATSLDRLGRLSRAVQSSAR